MQAFVCCRNLDLRRKQGIAGDMLLLTRQLRYFFCYSSARTMLLLALWNQPLSAMSFIAGSIVATSVRHRLISSQ